MANNKTGNSVSERIRTFNAQLIPDKVQLKYKLMAADVFRFFRGTCHLFYEDLSNQSLIPGTPAVWMCGDLHLENFGSYKGDNRLVYFDLNDFDESILGPASWELARIITSILVAFDSLQISEKKAIKCVDLFLEMYRSTLAKGKAKYIEEQTAHGIVRSFLQQVSKRTQKELMQKRIELHKNKVEFKIDNKRLFKINKELKKELMGHIYDWTLQDDKKGYEWNVVDAVFRVAGIGSLGVKRYVYLLESTGIKRSYWLLDMKQCRPSCLGPYVKIRQPAWSTEGERVINIKFRLQNVSPALQSCTSFQGDSYIIQEMQPTSDKIDFNLIKDRYADVEEVIRDMAMLTASAQLRSSGRQGSSITDELIAFGNTAVWEPQILEYGLNYAKQVKSDFGQYVLDYRNGFFERVETSGFPESIV